MITAFESERDLGELPELGEFLNFLENRCLILENLLALKGQSQKPVLSPSPNPEQRYLPLRTHLQTLHFIVYIVKITLTKSTLLH